MSFRSAFPTLLAAGLLASPAGAVDGVIEINQTCATLAGCFSGDGAGYPITIDGSAGSSYRLTSDLVVPDENTDGIVVSTSSITIDLNGFEIARLGCEGAISDCRPSGATGSGVTLGSASRIGTVVTDGTITGMLYGVNLGPQSRVSGLQARWNEVAGIGVFENSTVEGNTVHENGTYGIIAIGASRVQRNVVTGTQFGMVLGSETGYGDNVLNGNTLSVAGGVDMGGNVCDGSSTCP